MTEEKKQIEVLATQRKGAIKIDVIKGQYGVSVCVQKGYKKKGEDTWTNEKSYYFPAEAQAIIECLQDSSVAKVIAENVKKKED